MDKCDKYQEYHFSFLLHDSLLEVNVYEVVNNLSSLLDFKLARFRTVGGAGGRGHIDWGGSRLARGRGLGLKSREFDIGSREI